MTLLKNGQSGWQEMNMGGRGQNTQDFVGMVRILYFIPSINVFPRVLKTKWQVAFFSFLGYWWAKGLEGV